MHKLTCKLIACTGRVWYRASITAALQSRSNAIMLKLRFPQRYKLYLKMPATMMQQPFNWLGSERLALK